MISNLLLAASLLAGDPIQDPSGSWITLKLPGVSAIPSRAEARFPEASCAAIEIEPEGARDAEAVQPLVPAEVLVQLLEFRARETGASLTLLPRTPPLLARGSAQAIEEARKTLNALDQASEELRFSLNVSWIETNADSSSEEKPAAVEEFRAEYSPGSLIEVGELTSHSFLASYEVDVATDSSVANPRMGRFQTGRKLTLQVWRVLGGSQFFLRGQLDWSELLSNTPFELGAPDLGTLQQPRVAAAQIAFSALARPGEPVAIRITSPFHSQQRLGLALQLDDLATATNSGANSGSNSGANEDTRLRLHDLRFLSAASPTLPRLELGGEITFQSAGLEPVFRGVSARAMSSQKQRKTSSLYAASQALIEMGGEPSSADEGVGELIRAYEAARLQTGVLEFQRGELEVRVPTTAFCPTRVSVGTQVPRVVDYHSQIATEAWIPVPVVEVLFEGIVVDAEHAQGGLHCGALEVSDSAPRRLDRFEVGLGHLQLIARTRRQGHGRLLADESGRSLWPASSSGPALTAIFSSE